MKTSLLCNPLARLLATVLVAALPQASHAQTATLTTLVNFTAGANGGDPTAGLVQGSDGLPSVIKNSGWIVNRAADVVTDTESR